MYWIGLLPSFQSIQPYQVPDWEMWCPYWGLDHFEDFAFGSDDLESQDWKDRWGNTHFNTISFLWIALSSNRPTAALISTSSFPRSHRTKFIKGSFLGSHRDFSIWKVSSQTELKKSHKWHWSANWEVLGFTVAPNDPSFLLIISKGTKIKWKELTLASSNSCLPYSKTAFLQLNIPYQFEDWLVSDETWPGWVMSGRSRTASEPVGISKQDNSISVKHTKRRWSESFYKLALPWHDSLIRIW